MNMKIKYGLTKSENARKADITVVQSMQNSEQIHISPVVEVCTGP